MDERGFVHVFAEHDLAHFNQRVNEFKDGAFFLALLLDVPVIPIAIVVKRRKWRGKTPAWLPPRVTVAIERRCIRKILEGRIRESARKSRR